ncbi:unnamed protein product [Linum tenue]|uniref:Uncharacterized protein n=1 Tax=Linum tenue TaxID=586396 RepID=A0AAV0L1G3_9ROSI|nr:unnamed protein product [Linum tenue]
MKHCLSKMLGPLLLIFNIELVFNIVDIFFILVSRDSGAPYIRHK